MNKEEKALHKKATMFLQDAYNLPLSIPVKRNNRLRSTLGRFVHDNRGMPLRIELSGSLLNYGAKEVIIGILKHECIHYAFHILGKKASDGDDEFEKELTKHAAPSTHTQRVGLYFVVTCKRCGKEMETNIKRVRNYPDRYRTACCKAALVVKGERIYDGSL